MVPCTIQVRKIMFNRIAAIALLSVALSFSAHAAVEESFVCPKGAALPIADATRSLTAVQTAYEKVQAFSTRFIQQSFLAALEISEDSSGTVWFSRPGKMKWNYETPSEQTFLVNDETLWYYQAEERQLLVDTFHSAFSSDVPATFLMGVGKLSEQFTLKSACRNSRGLVFELAPRESEEKGFMSFRLLVGPQDNIPRGAQVVDRGGNRTSIVLAPIKAIDAVDISVFVAHFPKDIDIDDRRVRREEEGDVS